jgi:hypothetical protein
MIRLQVGMLICAALAALGCWLFPPDTCRGCTLSHDSMAAATLKSAVLPAEIVAAARLLVDRDGDGVGEYTTFSDLADHNLLAPDWGGRNGGSDVHNGSHFSLFLPTADGGAIDASSLDAVHLSRRSADARERHFVAYAWPADKDGRRMFAITEDGDVYATRPCAHFDPPTWNALFADGKWGTKPDPKIWLAYRK